MAAASSTCSNSAQYSNRCNRAPLARAVELAWLCRQRGEPRKQRLVRFYRLLPIGIFFVAKAHRHGSYDRRERRRQHLTRIKLTRRQRPISRHHLEQFESLV